MNRIISTLFASILLSSTVLADTVVTIKEGDGETNKVSIQKDTVRIGWGSDEYMIGDLKAKMLYVIRPSERQVLDLKFKDKPANSNVKTNLKEKGKGPKIAGYNTKEYALTANGQNCGSIFVSNKAAKNTDIKKLLSVMDNLNPDSIMPEGMGGMMQGMMDPCTKATADSMSKLPSIGMPMKMTGGAGELDNEVISIDTSAKLDPSLFKVPEGYNHTTPTAMMNDAMQQMQEALKSITPEQQEMMKNMMKQFGGMAQ